LPPGPPTDPYVPNSGIRLVTSRLRLPAALSVAVTWTGVPGLGVPARCPDHSSVPRPPLPSAGSSRVEFPGFHGTTKGSDPCRPVSPDSWARPAIPSVRRDVRSPQAPTRPGRPGVFGFGNSASRKETREGSRSLRFLGNPGVCPPCSRTPAGPAHQARTACRRGPSARSDGGLAARNLISGLQSTASTLTVYASPARSPGPTQDSFLAAGQALPGGIGYPQGSDERFPSYNSSPFPKLCRTQERHSSPAAAAGETLNREKPKCRRVRCSGWFGRAPLLPAGCDRARLLR
jgi:hypothetical protein